MNRIMWLVSCLEEGNQKLLLGRRLTQHIRANAINRELLRYCNQ